MKISQFNDNGLQEFARSLRNYDEILNLELGKILMNNLYTQTYSESEIEVRFFQNRFEFGKYLNSLFNNENDDIHNNNLLWSWITAVYFDQICPIDSQGKRSLKVIDRYIYNTADFRYYKHIAYFSWRAYNLHEEYSKIFLYTKLDKSSDLIDKFGPMFSIFNNKTLVRLLYKLYFNEMGFTLKNKVLNRSHPGNYIRFINVIQQLELNYDFYNMNLNEIENLLPDEFNDFIIS